MMTHHSILLIEDSPGERELFRLALAQTGLDVALYTEQDAEAGLHFLEDRMHHSPYSPCEAAGVISTARTFSPAQPQARRDAPFPERGPSETTRSTSTETTLVISPSSSPLQEGGPNWSPTARTFSPTQPQARQDAPFPAGAHSDRAASASKGDHSGHPLSLPSLILLDWHLGKQRGDEFLKHLRADSRLAAIPVVVFTTSDDHHDLSLAYASGANGYVIKPGTFDELIQCTADICRYWMDRNRIPHMIGTPC